MLTLPPAAHADPIPDLLAGGATLGEVTGVLGSSKSVSTNGPCTSESYPDGYAQAAVYRTTASADSLLRISVSDDLDGSLSVCRVAVHEVEEGTTTPPATPPLTASDDCAGDSGCDVQRWLDEGAQYLVVVWAAPPEPGGDVQSAIFEFDASVKLPAGVTTTVTGHRLKDQCTGAYQVTEGKNYSVTSKTTPVVEGVLDVVFERLNAGAWVVEKTLHPTLGAGLVAFWFRAGPSATYRIRSILAETETRLGASALVTIVHVTPKWAKYADGGVRLKVPRYKQQMRLSCEAATLRMAHNYFKAGHIDSDWDVLEVTGVDRRKKKGHRWGNPNKTFVGNPKGSMMKTGYGVHYGPIAAAANHFSPCRPSVTLKNPSRATIARYLAMGFPVIVWGAHPGATGIYKKRWKAWDGQWITAWSVEHTWVLIGFHGSPDKPSSFIIHNPSGAGWQKVSLKKYDAFTKYFRRAVVVRG